LIDIGFALERLTNHRFTFGAAIAELHEHGQRFAGKIGNRDRLRLRRVLDEQELRDFSLQLRDDVSRSPRSIAAAIVDIGSEKARAAERGPIDETVKSASKNSRSMALVNP
jgi:hypothetical protein